MIRSAARILLGLAAVAAWGQINYFPEELATNDDGSRLLFASSLRLRGSGDYFWPKIFLFDGGSPRLLTQREPPESFLALARPEINGDGTIIGYVVEPFRTQSFCVDEGDEAVLMGVPGRPEMRSPGRVKLSRNGRFALLYRQCRSMDLLDLVSGERTPLIVLSGDFIGVSGTGRRAVASDGTAVFVRNVSGRLTIGRRSGLSTLSSSHLAYNPVIDDQATTVVYETPGPNEIGEGRRGQIMVVDLVGGTGRELARGVGPSFEPALSNDGRLVMFLSWVDTGAAQVFVINRDASGLRQLSNEPDGIAKAVLSGDGRVVYALTKGGLLRRIEVGSGEVRDLIGRVLRLGDVYPAPVAGSMVHFSGMGLAAQAARATAPLPTSLGGVSVVVGGLAAPLLSVSPNEIWAQIPWEAPVGTPVVLDPGVGSPFEGPLQQPIRTVENVVGFYAEALHSDFRGPLTYADPARPGEIIQLYMGGLGPVDRPVATGAPSPSNPPATAVRPPSCRVRSGTLEVQEWPAEILFAGLAPGLVGIYQVSLRLPLGPYLPDTWLWCQYGLPPATLLLPIRNFDPPPRARQGRR